MKFNSLTSLGIASIILLGSMGSLEKAGNAAPIQSEPLSIQLTAQPQTLASGSFVTTEQDHPTTGNARIVNDNGQRYLEFDRLFDTASGPDVKVILYRDNTVPVSIDEQDYVTLAPLDSFSGAQRYEIPEGIDVDEFQSVAIWCEQFNVTFGYAAF